MKSALEIAHRQGFQDISVNQVMKRSAISKGGFFHHFESKNELLQNLKVWLERGQAKKMSRGRKALLKKLGSGFPDREGIALLQVYLELLKVNDRQTRQQLLKSHGDALTALQEQGFRKEEAQLYLLLRDALWLWQTMGLLNNKSPKMKLQKLFLHHKKANHGF